MNNVKNAAHPSEPISDTEINETLESLASAPPQEVDPIAVLEAEKLELKDKLLRTLADMENLRRRTEREVADARSYGVTKFAGDMVNTVDNLRRALESIPDEALSAADGAFKAFIEGVELTERDMLKSLERHGVKKLEPVGQKFDPNLHQAMFEAPHAEIEKGHVMQVVQSGFVIGGRSLRAAMVGVSSGVAKTATAN
jgi:molecular chaperone GrpE